MRYVLLYIFKSKSAINHQTVDTQILRSLFERLKCCGQLNPGFVY